MPLKIDKTNKTKDNTNLSTGVPIWRFYTLIALAAIMGWAAGMNSGEKTCKLEGYDVIIQMQGEANEIFKEEYGKFPSTRSGIEQYLLHD